MLAASRAIGVLERLVVWWPGVGDAVDGGESSRVIIPPKTRCLQNHCISFCEWECDIRTAVQSKLPLSTELRAVRAGQGGLHSSIQQLSPKTRVLNLGVTAPG